MSEDRSAHGLPGLFIVFEGGDGSGKTTQCDMLDSWLTSAGHSTVTTREPGGTYLGRTLRKLVLHDEDLSDRTEALLFAADRAHHVDTLIRPALTEGKVVISDRYIDSSIAYQGTARGLGGDIRDLSIWATDGLLPDLTIVLDLHTHLAAGRRKDTPDRLEREASAFHEAVRTRFLTLAAEAPDRYLVLDAALPTEQVHQLVVDDLTARFSRLAA